MRSTNLNNLFRVFRPSVPAAIAGLAVLSTIVVFAGAARAASPGALDLTFGSRGASAYASGTAYQESRTIAVQSDGKVILAGFACMGGPPCNGNFLIVRFNADGTFDNGFGTNGVVITDFSGETETVNALVVQADGKIVAAGGSVLGSSQLGFKLVRYMPDGTLDSNFGTGGRVIENFDNAGGTAYSMFIQPDGKIVAAGTNPSTMLFIARFESNGGLDTGFGTGGKIATNAYNVSEVRMTLQSDGKVVIAAESSPAGTLKLIRFNTNGTPDNDFGLGGVVTNSFAPASFVPALAVLSDGKILVSGADENNEVRSPPLRRFNSDGSVDGSLVPNHGEIFPTGFFVCSSCTQQVVRILPLPDGKFLLAGNSRRYGTSPYSFAVTRYWHTGLVDYSYGFHGASYFRHSSYSTDYPWGVTDAALQPDGKVVLSATGNLRVNNNPQLHLIALRVNAVVTPPIVRSDFDGDRKTDFAVFRPSTSFWYALRSSDGGINGAVFGANQDVLTPGDYNYDRKTDPSVFRPSQNVWYMSPSLPTGGGNPGGPFGQSGDITVQEDYDGDGMTDLASYRPSNGTWSIRYSSSLLAPENPTYLITFQFGVSTDRPVPADYDGDGRADIAVYRPSEGNWYILRTSDGLVTAVNFGLSADKTVQGDYDGDLKADIAVFREGAWYYLRSSDGGFVGIAWGLATDKPVPGDYDGDGKFDVAVYRPSEGVWYVLRSSDSGISYGHFGLSEDIPIPHTFVR